MKEIIKNNYKNKYNIIYTIYNVYKCIIYIIYNVNKYIQYTMYIKYTIVHTLPASFLFLYVLYDI